MKPVVFHKDAEDEVRAAIAYYDGQREGLGEEFQTELERVTAHISQFPQASSSYGKHGYRKCVMQRFPYTLFYLELDDIVWVAAVAHQRRRPGYWRD